MAAEPSSNPPPPSPAPRAPVPMMRRSPNQRAPLRLVAAPTAPPLPPRPTAALPSPLPPLIEALPISRGQPIVAGLAAVIAVTGTVLLFLKL